jgi:hypothetical protein
VAAVPPRARSGAKGKPSSARVDARAELTREQQWTRLWSIARYDLQLTSQEFYSLTPRQLDALIKRRERETQEREFLFAQLASVTANFGFHAPKEPISTKDFMPSEWARGNVKVVKRKRMTKKRRAEVARKVAALFGC